MGKLKWVPRPGCMNKWGYVRIWNGHEWIVAAIRPDGLSPDQPLPMELQNLTLWEARTSQDPPPLEDFPCPPPDPVWVCGPTGKSEK